MARGSGRSVIAGDCAEAPRFGADDTVFYPTLSRGSALTNFAHTASQNIIVRRVQSFADTQLPQSQPISVEHLCWRAVARVSNKRPHETSAAHPNIPSVPCQSFPFTPETFDTAARLGSRTAPSLSQESRRLAPATRPRKPADLQDPSSYAEPVHSPRQDAPPPQNINFLPHAQPHPLPPPRRPPNHHLAAAAAHAAAAHAAAAHAA
eukprot:CAMPEP_0172180554 /NCGR_PEP_ID=MMETSP1050-20130122/17301_1 /TAXON_ID=233186 /ORGANISM="Cryptomonas curvata, Strain CCAP979/52" /LENGTH=206 /DNA_ID=CAMNT_0012853687 /DNA_START=106 /DNA_END=723 /DNA_ORIENTATION=+